MGTDIQTIYEFLHAVQGNWRNSIYVDSSSCGRCGEKCPGDYLIIANEDGAPIAVPVKDMVSISGQSIAKDECIAVMRCKDIRTFYHLWLIWNADTDKECPVEQKGQIAQ